MQMFLLNPPGGYVFGAFLCLSVYLFVCVHDNSKRLKSNISEFLYASRAWPKGRNDYILGKIRVILWIQKQN